MPLYEYECSSCDHRIEVIQRFSDAPLTECSECGGEVKKLISAPAVQFKGTGWYVTDYGGRKKRSESSSSTEAKSSSEGEKSGGDSGGSDKSEAAGDKAKAVASSSSD